MDLKNDKRQHIQLELDFSFTRSGEACGTGREETESPLAAHDTESPANTSRLMEEVCEQDNLKEALRRVTANKGSAGIDGMTVGQLPDYLKQRWPADPGTIAERNLRTAAGKEGGNPQAGRRSAKAWHSFGAGSLYPASGDAGSAEAMGSDVLSTQLRFSARTVSSSGSGTGAAVYRPRLQLVY
jgi:hypothetical protein